jgi:acyl-CoA reductase-like NAD-dependent aldehyde dehydrogenase
LIHSNLIINGEKVKSVETIPILNPATKQPIADAPRASHEQLDTAVAAAKAAFPTWAATSWSERAGVLNALATLVEQHSNEFAVLLTKESGKPLSTGGFASFLAHFPLELRFN